jgi:hypothetical protein
MGKQKITLRKYPPLQSENPLIGQECLACFVEFVEGDILTLVPIGPGDNKEERAKCYAGQAYNAQALILHWACATGDPNPSGDLIILPPGSGEPLGSQ